MSDVINLRKNVNNLTSAELQKLRSAYKKAMKLNDNRGYAFFAGFHGYPQWRCWHGPQSKDGWPGVRLFFPWHRAYLYTFERALQDLEPGVTIPWWDWRSSGPSQNKIPKAFSDATISPSTKPSQKKIPSSILTAFSTILSSKNNAEILKAFNYIKGPSQKPYSQEILKAFGEVLTDPLQKELLKTLSTLLTTKLISEKTLIYTLKLFAKKLSTGQGENILEKVRKKLSEGPKGGEPNPLYSFRMKFPERNIDRDTMRFSGKSLGTPLALPTPSGIQDILSIPDNHFDDFNDALEDIHGLIHVWAGGEVRQGTKRVSGDMASIAFAAYDPIFWSHHCMIDKLWWDWQKKNGIDEIPKQYREMSLEPFGMTVDDVLDIYDLGYDYAGTETTINGNWSPVQS